MWITKRFLKLKWTFFIFFLFFNLLGFGLLGVNAQIKDNLSEILPQDLLKTNPSNIINERLIDECTNYDKETLECLNTEIRTQYIYPDKIISEQIRYINEEIIREDLTLRTNNSLTFPLGNNTFQIEIFTAPTFIKTDDVWKSIEYATTTIEAYSEQVNPDTPVTYLSDFLFFKPLLADDDSFYSGSGDGVVYNVVTTGTSQSDWDTVHDAISGSSISYTSPSTDLTRCTGYGSSKFQLGRIFLPFDTSTLDDDINITEASVFIYGQERYNYGQEWGIVETSQASETELVGDDFNNCGLVDSPIEGASRVILSDTLQYWEWELNSTGISWIDLEDYSLFGLRAEEDLDDTLPCVSCDDRFNTNFSEQTGTDKDPYLSITYTTGGGEATSTTATSTISTGAIPNFNDLSIISGYCITYCIVSNMSHMDSSTWIWKHA